MFGSDIMILVLKQIKCWEGFGWGGAQGRYINQYKQDSKKKKKFIGKILQHRRFLVYKRHDVGGQDVHVRSRTPVKGDLFALRRFPHVFPRLRVRGWVRDAEVLLLTVRGHG